MRRLLLALAGVLLPASAAAQAQFTYAQLKTLDTPALSRLLLGASGETMVEHGIAVGDGSFGAPRGTMLSVSFAAAPEFRTNSTCVAKSVRITFLSVAPRSAGVDPPVRIWNSEARQRWAILPEGAKDCSVLRPLLDSDTAASPYFDASGYQGQDLDANDFGRAVRMLRRVLADPQGTGPVRCAIDFDGPDRRQGICEALRLKELFDVRRIDRLQVGDCRFARPPASDKATCVSFTFPDPREGPGRGTYLQLALITDLPEGTRLTDTARIVRISISKVSWVA